MNTMKRNYWIETFHKTTEKDFPVPKAALAPDKDAGARGRVLRFLFEAEAVSRSGEENYEILGVWYNIDLPLFLFVLLCVTPFIFFFYACF